MVNIAVIGATGRSGSKIIAELLSRPEASTGDIHVTAFVRDEARLDDVFKNKVQVVKRDIFDLSEEDLAPFNIIINAFGTFAPDTLQDHSNLNTKLVEILANKPEQRLIVVGGGGSLYTDASHTTQLFQTESFPAEYLAIATVASKVLDDLKAQTTSTWTFLSPPLFFDPNGPRTGKYSLGGEELLLNAEGNSYISYSDYAIAIVDEVLTPKHVNKRFTVVGESK